GHTQFLTMAQGMPAHIEETLTKMIRDFIWDSGVSPRIALELLHKPLCEGGLNLLDIKAQNDAIDIIWLKSYLNLSPTRPTWAIVTDILINAAAPPRTSAVARVNTFIQTWDAPTQGPRAATLGEDIIRMLKTAKKYNTNLVAIHLSPALRAKLPAWYHPGGAPRPLTSIAAKCLLTCHSVKTI
ncbi:hypothetical protein EDB87DRAFT_1540322, partial [Lactarius vividus]